MDNASDHASIKQKQRSLREAFPETMGLRVHRTISWIGRAEQCEDDDDARFIFLWIAFNAAYGDAQTFQATDHGDRSRFTDYFNTLVALDTDDTIYNALWHQFSGPVRVLMDNHYVYHPFWQYHNGVAGYDDWSERFERSASAFRRAFQQGDTVRALSFVFDRLYVLRNQIVHGGATWNSRVNRDQVRDGASILAFLMPVFVHLMMDNPHEDWGRPFFPVVD